MYTNVLQVFSKFKYPIPDVMNNPKRIVIYPKDVMVLTGRSERYGRELIRKIKDYLDKEKHQFVTTHELADYLGLDVEEVQGIITY